MGRPRRHATAAARIEAFHAALRAATRPGGPLPRPLYRASPDSTLEALTAWLTAQA